jgi:hypothetical protein
MTFWFHERPRLRWNQYPAEPEPRVEPGPEDFITMLPTRPIVQSDLWSDMPSYPEPGQMGAFLVATAPLPTQPRTYGTEEDLREDCDDSIDEPFFPGEETSSEDDDDDHDEDELEDDPCQRKPASGFDQIMFLLLPDDWGKRLLTRRSELYPVDFRA